MSEKIANEKAVDRIIRAIDKALAPTPPPDPATIAAKTLRAVVGKQSVCSPADKAEILKLDAAYSAAYQAVLNADYPHSKQAFMVEQRRQEAMIAAGQFDGSDFWSQADFSQDFIERQATAKRSMLLISVKACTISKPICGRVSSLLNEQADAVEQSDRAQSARYAVEFSGSPVASRLRQLAALVMARVANAGGSRPKTYAPFLFE